MGVERDTNHALAPSFLSLMTGDRSPGQIVRPVRSLLRRAVQLATSPVQRIMNLLGNWALEADQVLVF